MCHVNLHRILHRHRHLASKRHHAARHSKRNPQILRGAIEELNALYKYEAAGGAVLHRYLSGVSDSGYDVPACRRHRGTTLYLKPPSGHQGARRVVDVVVVACAGDLRQHAAGVLRYPQVNHLCTAVGAGLVHGIHKLANSRRVNHLHIHVGQRPTCIVLHRHSQRIDIGSYLAVGRGVAQLGRRLWRSAGRRSIW